MLTRAITGFELSDPSLQDYIVLDINPARMTIADAPELAAVVESVINLRLGRDAVRVTPLIARLEEIHGV